MYPTLLLLHSWLRWAVILLGLIATIRAIAGAWSKRPWVAMDDRVSKLFGRTLDLQMLLGLVLYFFLSPITKAAMSDFGGAMGVSAMRFWAVEHWLGMVIAIALVHVGIARAKRAPDGPAKHRTLAIFFTLAMLAILASIPWPGRPYARPLIRW
jgi:hypothetical protein